MCGLAGAARPPHSKDFPLIKRVTEELIQGIEHRGRHATGIATVGGSNPFVWKWAAPASRVIASEAWQKTMQAVAANTRLLIGHTRHATLPNAAQNEAAHPFKYGKVVGAHNGMIHNWRELAAKTKGGTDWIVDSEAAFALLSQHKDPAEALDQLNGWWALTWANGADLYVTRTHDVPLAMAYVEELLTLFWCSEKQVLERILDRHKLDYASWEIKPNTIYQYDTRLFTKEGTGVVREKVAFSGKTMEKQSRRPVVHNSRWSKWDEPGRQWEQTSMPLSRNYVSLTELQAQVDKLASKVETLQSENDFLFALLDDAGLLTAELDRAVTDATGKPTIVLPARVSEDKDDEGEATATPEPQAPAIAPPPAVPAMSQIWQEGSESFPDPDKVIGFPS